MNNLRSEKFSSRVRTSVARRRRPTAPAPQFAGPRGLMSRLISSKVHFRQVGPSELLLLKRVPDQTSLTSTSPAKYKRHMHADRLPGLFN